VEFIETPTFTAALRRHLDDDSYRALQLALILRPEQGAIIPGGAGVRKMRWAGRDKGKRGGLRVIYYWLSKDQIFHMLYMYSKNEQRDLSRAQIKTLARAVREELK
jgi:hypothetical protein